MKKFMTWFTKEESGQGMVEYGLILALISIAAIAVLPGVGQAIVKIFQKITEALGNGN